MVFSARIFFSKLSGIFVALLANIFLIDEGELILFNWTHPPKCLKIFWRGLNRPSQCFGNSMLQKETEWVDRILNGDPEAEDQVLRLVSPTVFIIVRKKLRDRVEDVKEVKSEILMTLLLKLREGKFDPSKGSLQQYVAGISFFKINDYFKSSKRRNRQNLSIDSVPDIPTDDHGYNRIEDKELTEQVSEMLETLSQRHRTILYLYFYDGLRPREIAEKLRISARKVTQMKSYALKSLEKKIRAEKTINIPK